MRGKKERRYSVVRNTVEQVMAGMLAFVLAFSAVFVVGVGKTTVVKADATETVTFYYYDPDCTDNQCLALGLYQNTWGKLENTGTWIGNSSGFTWFEKEGGNWFSCTIKYDPDTYMDSGVGMAVARLAEGAQDVTWGTDVIKEFSSSDSSYPLIFGSDFKDPAFKDGTVVSYASLTQSTPTYSKSDIQALIDKAPADLSGGAYEQTSASALQEAMSNASTHISSGDDAQNEAVYTELKNALDSLRYYDASIVVKKVEGLGSDFIKGVDVSSYITLTDSGVVFYNFEGQQLDAAGFFKLFADAGANYVRIRIWNDPKNAAGEYYGGGNNDINTAVTICRQIQAYNTQYNDNMKVLIDFHYSDFWVDPDKQKAPKAWQSMALNEKTAALKTFTQESLEQIAATGIEIGMVQIGNETNNGICGETGIGTAGAGMCAVFQAGCEAIDAYNSAKGTNILKVVHFTDPHKQDNAVYNAKTLLANGVNYDVYATSYYPYWHQTTDELAEVLGKIADETGKKVMVAETQEIYTNADADGFDNQAYEGKNNIDTSAYPVSVQGQADEFRDVIAAVASVGEAGIGMFYWEPAWLPVGYAYNEDGTKNETVYAHNQELWKTKGSGWASPAAEEFDESVKQWGYGGTNCENAALFDFTGHPLPSLNVFKYVNYGTSGASETYYGSKFDVKSVTAKVGMGAEELKALLPSTVTATTNYGNEKTCEVVWDDAVLQKIAADIATNAAAGNTYTAQGVIAFDGASPKVSMQVEVIPVENRLVNGDFEAGNTGWEFGNYTYAKAEATNSKGSVSCDVSTYNITDPVPYTTTVKQTVVITDPGYYSLIGFAEGNSGVGNTGLGESICLQVTDGAGKQYTSNQLELQGWMIWQKASIEKIMVTQQMIDAGTNTLEVAWVLTLNADRWGTLDDTYLFKTEDITDTSGGNTTPGTPGGTAPGTSGGTSTPGTSGGTTAPSTPAPGNSNKPSDNTTDKPADNTESKPQEITYTVDKQADGSMQIVGSDGTVLKGQLYTDTDGRMYYAREDGKVAVKEIILVDKVKYFAKEDGVIAKNEFCTTAKGSTVYATADGALAVNRVVNLDGKKYYAKSSCALAKDGFYITAMGSKIYAKASGELITNKVFKVDGKKYCAKPSGALVRDRFYTLESGKKVYAKPSGVLVVNQLFKVRGKQFYADKSGIIAVKQWVTVGNKQYYCSAAYKITKTRKISA